MNEEKKQAVMMTEAQLAEYEAYQRAKAAKTAKEQAKRDRAAYGTISAVKGEILERFSAILQMKADVLRRVKEDQKSHTFTTSDGTRRIIIGRHQCDGWKDTVNDGVAIVKEACLSLIKDDTTRALVNQMMRLLSRDAAGNLKANKALQLRKLANELNDERLNEGITIIEEAYIPQLSKTYIYAEYKDEKSGAWKQIPLGMTEA